MIEVDFQLKRKNFMVSIGEQFGEGITGIFGPSGAGKTSLLQAIAGLAVPEKGKISIKNKPIFNTEKKINLPVNKRNIGYVFQEGRLFPHLNIEKNLLYGVKKNIPQKINFDKVVNMLNLKHLLHSKPANISGGERQRVALGRSLLASPDILLLDEPFSAVDVRLRSQILPFLLKIHRQTTIPILVVSHDLPDLLKLTNKLCIIRDGKCIGHDDYYELLKSTEILEIFDTGTIVNSVNMQVTNVDTMNRLTILSSKNTQNNIRIVCEKSRDIYSVGQELKLFIGSDDIALSSQKLNDVTIQNQIKGTITHIFYRQATTLCMVDVGFRLAVEITAESRKRMDIAIGSKVWCLFKSVAIDVAN